MIKTKKKINLFAMVLLIATLISSFSIDARRGRGGRRSGGRRSGRRGSVVHRRSGGFRGGRRRHYSGGGRRRGYYPRRGYYSSGYYGGLYYDPWLYSPYWGLGLTVDLTSDRYDSEPEVTSEEIIERARQARSALEKRIDEMKEYLETLEKDLEANNFKKKDRLLKKHAAIEQDLDDLESDLRAYSGTDLKRYTSRIKNIDKSIKRLQKKMK